MISSKRPITLVSHSFRWNKNSGGSVIFELKILFGHIIFFLTKLKNFLSKLIINCILPPIVPDRRTNNFFNFYNCIYRLINYFLNWITKRSSTQTKKSLKLLTWSIQVTFFPSNRTVSPHLLTALVALITIWFSKIWWLTLMLRKKLPNSTTTTSKSGSRRLSSTLPIPGDSQATRPLLTMQKKYGR